MTHERVLCERCSDVIKSCRCPEGTKHEVRRGLCPKCIAEGLCSGAIVRTPEVKP